MKCVRCGEKEAEYTCDCLVVQHTNSSYLPNQRLISDRLAGSRRAGLCPECLDKYATLFGFSLDGYYQTVAFVGAVAGIVGLINRSKGGWFPVLLWLGVGLVVAAALLFVADLVVSMRVMPGKMRQTPWMVIGKREKEANESDHDRTVLVPVGDGYYRSFKQFKRINDDLSDETLKKLYKDYIENGAWKALVDSDASEG